MFWGSALPVIELEFLRSNPGYSFVAGMAIPLNFFITSYPCSVALLKFQSPLPNSAILANTLLPSSLLKCHILLIKCRPTYVSISPKVPLIQSIVFSTHVPAFSSSHELEPLEMTEQLDVIPDLLQFLIPFIYRAVGTIISFSYSRTITHRAEWSYAPLPTQEFSWNN